MTNLIEAKNIEKSFKIANKTINVLNGVDFHIKENQMVSIMGVSGSGKSTLLHILGLLNKPDKGEVYLLENKIKFENSDTLAKIRNAHIGFVFQFYSLIGELTVEENIGLPYIIKNNINPPQNLIKNIADLVGLSLKKLKSFPNTLSGGELQRVALARALINSPNVVIADEPTANLDKKSSIDIVETMRQVNRETGHSFIIATHSYDVAEKCDKILYLSEGVLSEKYKN